MVRNSLELLAGFVLNEIPAITHILHRLKLTASVLHRQGFAEANAGNVSIRVSKHLAAPLREAGFSFVEGEWFLVSISGSRYRDIAMDPASGLVLIHTGDKETIYPHNCKPTSEWKCHKMLHKLDEQNFYPCLLHAHPTEIIALCHSPLYKDEALLNQRLSTLLPELPLYLEKGIATSDFAKPGSMELAEGSCKDIKDRKVLIWDKHGILCRGTDIDQCLDYLEIVNKAAKLFFLLGD
ncbi:MAG: class II aldolase/adducin family protein [Candidatus Cloacimonetes bacterium]|nr:class II aldolase/adducin family protein [Candidatus Cloacimonadota bacterium]